jgi:hemolysin III
LEASSIQLLARPRQAILSAFLATDERPQTRAEEIANSLSHGLGLAAALAASAFLIATAVQRGPANFIAGVSVYAATLVVLYLASTLYHALPVGRAKAVLLVCDHAAIFLFIAGTYTPFTFGVLRGPWGFALFFAVWGLALGGIAFKVVGGAARYPKLSTGLYLGMGWVLLLAAGPVWRLMPPGGLLWLLAGGFAYTAGVAFFRAEGMRYAHFIWHLFVLAGTVCHFIAVLRYAGGV